MTRKTLLILGLLAVFVLSACTSTAVPPTPTPVNDAEPAVPPVEESAPVQEEVPAAAPAVATEMPAEEPMAAPTSRGNQLVATDPNAVNLASGEPQLIEFFAFW